MCIVQQVFSKNNENRGQSCINLVLSHSGLAFVLMLRPFSSELVVFSLNFEHPSVLLFCIFPICEVYFSMIRVNNIMKIDICFLVAPQIRVVGETVFELDEGNDLNLKCKAYGVPTPYITWRAPNGLMLQGGSYGVS